MTAEEALKHAVENMVVHPAVLKHLYFRAVLERHNGNQTKAAKAIGIDRGSMLRTLRKRVKL